MLLPTLFYTTNSAFPQSRFPKLAEPVFTYFRAVVFHIYTVASATFPGMSAPISRHENRFHQKIISYLLLIMNNGKDEVPKVNNT